MRPYEFIHPWQLQPSPRVVMRDEQGGERLVRLRLVDRETEPE